MVNVKQMAAILQVRERTLYRCRCSQSGSACNVFYADGMGFGCLQSSCSGSCTGRFVYKGCSVDRVAVTMDKEQFLASPEAVKAANEVSPMEAFAKITMYGFSFYVVNDEKTFLAKAACDCEGTQACKLKTITLPFLKGETAGKKIYYCDGGCNGCELTIYKGKLHPIRKRGAASASFSIHMSVI